MNATPHPPLVSEPANKSFDDLYISSTQEHNGTGFRDRPAEVAPAYHPKGNSATARDSESCEVVPNLDEPNLVEQRAKLDHDHALTNAEFMLAIFSQLPEENGVAIASFTDIARPNWAALLGQPAAVPDRPNKNTYFCPSSMRPGGKRDLEHFAALYVVVLDDIKAGVLEKLPPPTYALETSAGNYQVGYQLEVPLADLGLAQAIHHALHGAGYCDSTGNNPVRWVRLPIGINTKPGKMFQHALKIWEPGRRFEPMALAGLLELNLKVEPGNTKESDPFANMPEPKLLQPGALAGLLKKLDSDLMRDDWRVVLSCIFAHLGEDGRIVAHDWCATGAKFMIDRNTKRALKQSEAEAQFRKVWKEIAADTGFRMGAGALFGILQKQHTATDGKRGMSPSDIAQWHRTAGETVPDQVDTQVTNTIPFSIDYPPGLVGDIAKYVHGASLTPIKSFSIAAGLFAMSLLSANRYYGGRMDTGLNLFMICCAPTGVGKDASRKALKKLFADTHFLKHIWEKAASATGMLRALSRCDPPLFALMSDEIGLTLQSYSGARVNGNDKLLMGLILNLFGSARQPMSGSAYAKADDNIEPIRNPFLTLFGSSTPEALYPAFNMEMVTLGTVNRIVVVGAGGIDPEPECLNFEVPEQLQNAIRKFERNAGFAPDGVGAIADAVAARQAGDVAIEFDPNVFEYLQGFIDSIDTEGQPEALWGRYREQIIRVATLLAVGDGGTITKNHVTWAQKWIDWCVRNFNRRLVPLLTNTDFSKKAGRVLEIIQNAKKYGGDKRWGPHCKRGLMPMAKLKKTLPMPGREFDPIISHLLETEQISTGKEGNICVFWVP